MAVDLKSDGLPADCKIWLEETLSEIEAAKRIEATREISKKAPHYHVTVATHEYEAWLDQRLLTEAVFFEGNTDEETDGLRAIAWTIRNRVESAEFPNTIEEVVREGEDRGKRRAGCQFSYKCDGKPEDRYMICRTASGTLTPYWRRVCDNRWERAAAIAAQVLAEKPELDPTGGAVLYHATYLKQVQFTPDMREGTIRTIGDHKFACSTKRGDDICGKKGRS